MYFSLSLGFLCKCTISASSSSFLSSLCYFSIDFCFLLLSLSIVVGGLSCKLAGNGRSGGLEEIKLNNEDADWTSELGTEGETISVVNNICFTLYNKL